MLICGGGDGVLVMDVCFRFWEQTRHATGIVPTTGQDQKKRYTYILTKIPIVMM